MEKSNAKPISGWNLTNSYARLPAKFFSVISPTPVQSPQLIILNDALAQELDLAVQELHSKHGLAILSGNTLPENSLPLAQAYAGHQFGHFAMLGDGRAILLGEQLTAQGRLFDIQLKGAGSTPYSRRGDGRAALGPMLREYIISEAMHFLGIPTTRSLAVVTTGEPVLREKPLAGAILTRVAASHLRIATFQYAAGQSVDDLKALADYALERHFPKHQAAVNPYQFLLQEVIKRQAKLIAQWQLIGFIHGVMNTDNITISGETIDYGPCAFMDTYDPNTVFSSIDAKGRYAYGNQPTITAWNLARFAETLLPLLHDKPEQALQMANDALSTFKELYHTNWLTGMRKKLGILNEANEDEQLIHTLLNLMAKYAADYTNTFIALTFEQYANAALFATEDFKKWQEAWQTRLRRQQQPQPLSHDCMRQANPAVIPRNHRVEAALTAAVEHEDYSVMTSLLQVLSEPYAHTPQQAEYAAAPAKTACPYRTYCGT